MRITLNGTSAIGPADLPALIDHARTAAADGFDTWWLAQTGLVETLTVFAVIGREVPCITLGTAVVPTFTRHPTALAGQALSTAALIGDPSRLVLGIGLSHKPAVEDRYGLVFERPVRHLLDYLDILQPMLETGRVDHHGTVWSTTMEANRPCATAPSVMVAALGPQLLRIAGRRTDGTLLWMVGPRTVAEHIAPVINAAAAEAGRPAPRIVASLPVCVTDDVTGARAAAAAAFANYGQLPSYRAMLDREGVAGPAEAALIGNAAEVEDRLGAIADAGATEFSAVEFTRNPDEAAATRALLVRLNRR
jgi:F420-dependent oxidoreductase-like protein